MELDGDGLDMFVHEVIREVRGSISPTREEIAQLVLDYITARMNGYVLQSLERLVKKGSVIEDRDISRGRPYIYYLPLPNNGSDDAQRP